MQPTTKVGEKLSMTISQTDNNDDLLVEFDSTLAGERCKVCNEICSNVNALQNHIMNNHCKMSETETLIRQILKNQELQNQHINAIAVNQRCIKTDIELMKTAPCFHTPSPPSSSSRPARPAPACPTTMAQVVRQTLPPPVTQHQAPASPQEQQPATNEILSHGSSVLYMGDSIFRNVYMEKIEKATKSKVKVVKAYSATYNNNKHNKFKTSNFTDLLLKELNNRKHDAVVMQASSVDLTNYRSEPNKE